MLWRLWRLVIILCTGLTAKVVADANCQGQTRINLGYRQDDFHWSIAGTNGSPNVLSELKWQKLHMLEASIFSWHTDFYNYIPYVRWSGSYSAIMRGKVSDRDFALNNRCGEFSRAEANCYRGAGFDLNGGIGWPLVLRWCGKVQLAPIIGIGMCQQHLHMHDGLQKIALNNPELLGRIYGLRSEYRVHWWGPWTGLDAQWELNHRWTFNGGFEYHWSTRYRARGDWNLRPEFDRGFYHRAQGHAWIGRLGVAFAFDCYWLFCIDATVKRWRTGDGTDKTRLHAFKLENDDDSVCPSHQTIYTPFNGARWDSYSITGGLVYRY